MKKTLLLVCALMAVIAAAAQSTTPLVHFDFSSTSDVSATYQGTLCQGAKLVPYGESGQVLQLGDADGYFDFGSSFGDVIASLDGNYSLSLNVFIPEDANLGQNGNFVWCFARSSSEGYLFFSAKDTRFAISKTNYSGEYSITGKNPLQKGRWNHVAVVSRNQSMRLYVNGVSASKTIHLQPSEIGKTVENYLGRSCYEGDAYLRGALYSDFRLYNQDINSSEIGRLIQFTKQLNAYADSLRLDAQMKAFSPGDLTQLKTDVELPTTFGELKIEWTSSDNGVITADGHITRPAHGSPIATATLTARLIPTDPQYESLARERQFPVSVLPELSDEETVAADAALLVIPGHPNNVYTDLTLPTVAENGSVVFWKSSDPEWITDEGRVQKLPEGQKRTVTLTATILKGEARITRDLYRVHERAIGACGMNVFQPRLETAVARRRHGLDLILQRQFVAADRRGVHRQFPLALTARTHPATGHRQRRQSQKCPSIHRFTFHFKLVGPRVPHGGTPPPRRASARWGDAPRGRGT